MEPLLGGVGNLVINGVSTDVIADIAIRRGPERTSSRITRP
ncbi:hypothetical protein [Saccharothrix coeruleofusca]|nr:hypothetical protein [Saccharothrix coeruleofusca]